MRSFDADGKKFQQKLVGGFNPSKKYKSNWVISTSSILQMVGLLGGDLSYKTSP